MFIFICTILLHHIVAPYYVVSVIFSLSHMNTLSTGEDAAAGAVAHARARMKSQFIAELDAAQKCPVGWRPISYEMVRIN